MFVKFGCIICSLAPISVTPSVHLFLFLYSKVYTNITTIHYFKQRSIRDLSCTNLPCVRFWLVIVARLIISTDFLNFAIPHKVVFLSTKNCAAISKNLYLKQSRGYLHNFLILINKPLSQLISAFPAYSSTPG
jgi:hypothetical protein